MLANLNKIEKQKGNKKRKRIGENLIYPNPTPFPLVGPARWDRGKGGRFGRLGLGGPAGRAQ